MCIDEFVAYMCGHRSMAVLRTCPSTTAQHNLPVCSVRPVRQYHADTMCSPCERLMHTRWVLIREWEHRFYHERGACGCPVIFPNLITRPRVIGGPGPAAPAAAAPGMGGAVAGAGAGVLGAPHPSLPPKPFWLSGPEPTISSSGVVPPAGSASVPAGPASLSGGSNFGSGSGVGSGRVPAGPSSPPVPTGPAPPTAPAAHRRGRGRGRNGHNSSSRGDRSGAASGSGTSGTSATASSGSRSGASVPVPTITVTPPAGPSGPSTSTPVRPPVGPATPAPVAGPVPPIFSEETVGNRQHVAVRLPGLYAAEWTEDHRALHEAFPTHCPVDARPVRHISDEEEMTNEERALLEDCRLLAGMDPADLEIESMIASTAARIGGIFPGSNSATIAAQALTAGQGPLHPDILDFEGMRAVTHTLPEETAETARSDLPVLGLPVGAGPEGTSHMQPFAACRLTRPQVKRRKSCEF